MISLFINMRVTINVMLALKCKLLMDNCTLYWNKASVLKIAYWLQTGSVSILCIPHLYFVYLIIRIYPANNNEPLVCPRDVIKWSPEISRTFCHCTLEVLSSSLGCPQGHSWDVMFWSPGGFVFNTIWHTLCMFIHTVIIIEHILTWDLNSQPLDSRHSNVSATPQCLYQWLITTVGNVPSECHTEEISACAEKHEIELHSTL